MGNGINFANEGGVKPPFQIELPEGPNDTIRNLLNTVVGGPVKSVDDLIAGLEKFGTLESWRNFDRPDVRTVLDIIDMSAGGSVWDPNFDRVGVGGENPNGIIFGDVNPTTSPTLDGVGLPPHIMGKKYYGDKEKDIKKEYGSKTGKRPIHADEARSNARWDGISDDAARRQLAFEREWESGQGETYAVGPDRSKQMYVEQQEAAYQDHQSTMRQKQTDYEQAWEDYHSPATRRSSLEDEYKELSNQLLGSGPKIGYTTDPWETVFTRALDDPQLAEMLGRLAMIGNELGPKELG